MFRGITKTLNKFQKKNDEITNSITDLEISSYSNNENDLNTQVFNSTNSIASNSIRNSQIEYGNINKNQNIISSQTKIKQEIPIQNSQISESQNSNYRRTRQNPLNNKHSSSSYKRSNTQTSKYNKPFKIPSIVEKKPNDISNSQINTVNNQLNKRCYGNRISNSQFGFRSSNIFYNNEFNKGNEDNKINFNKNSFIGTSSISSSNKNSSNSSDSYKKLKIPGPAGRLPVLTPDERKILFYSHHINDIMKKRNNNYSIATQFKKNAQYNSFKRAKERVDLALNKNEVFESGSWVLMLRTLDLSQTKTKIIDIVKLRFPIEKIKSIVVLIKRIKAGDLDVSLIVQDPTGDMPAIMTKEAYEKYFGIMNQGTTLLLTNVSVFVLYKKGSYLNIGIKNISKIYTLDNITKAPIVIDIDKVNLSSKDIEKDIELAQNIFKGKNVIDFSDDDEDSDNENHFHDNRKGKKIENTNEKNNIDKQLDRSTTSKTIVKNSFYEDSEKSLLISNNNEEIKIQSTQVKVNENQENVNIPKQDKKVLEDIHINNNNVNTNNIKIENNGNELNEIKNETKNSNSNNNENDFNDISDDNTNLDESDDSDNIDDLMNDINFERSQELYSSFMNISNRKRSNSDSEKQDLDKSNVKKLADSITNSHTIEINKFQCKKTRFENITKENISASESLNNINDKNSDNIYSSGSAYSSMFQRTESLEIELSTSNDNNIFKKSNTSSRPTQTTTDMHSQQNTHINNMDDNANDNEIIQLNSPIPEKQKSFNYKNNNKINEDINNSLFLLKKTPKEKSVSDEDEVDELDLLMDDLESIY
ncbi:hypothetical protein BCR36DRAFT_403083 [Piromyces finnis]|uniref:Homologous recombination OB-fold protein OB-fold domain-containing protein n=1 Tax=Piromyces finnis TaxID=1754191 RepID=A0A1Y1VHG8_9FUNG|nr:hypothetical protein BCR36DRAFT_403083 [Piromyces finnis]|eukprot:ORX55523.1 hypothetical protein BCR36DRAFT_403083 [Piromyces finnis]